MKIIQLHDLINVTNHCTNESEKCTTVKFVKNVYLFGPRSSSPAA